MRLLGLFDLLPISNVLIGKITCSAALVLYQHKNFSYFLCLIYHIAILAYASQHNVRE